MVHNSSTGNTEYWPVSPGDSPYETRRLPSANNSGLTKTGHGAKLADEMLLPLKLSLAFRSGGWKLWVMFFMTLHILAAPGFAQVSKEYQLKAVFLWRLAQFTEWPPDAFEHAESPIAVCVLGETRLVTL